MNSADSLSLSGSPVRFREANEQEYRQVMELLLEHETEDRKRVVKQALLEALFSPGSENGKANPWNRVMVHDTEVVGAAVWKQLGGRASLLLGGGVSPTFPFEIGRTLNRLLWEESLRGLQQKNTRFIQTLRGLDDQSEFMEHAHFDFLANLEYLTLDLAEVLSLPEIHAPDHQYQPVGKLADRELIRILEATYEGSRDCPRFSNYRTVADVVESYRAAGQFQIENWYLLIRNQEPLGCLLLANYEDSSLVEITYMGIIPRVRGSGLGRVLLSKACARSRELGAKQLVLAVDRENHPAKRLYKAFGFSIMLSESVWGRTIPEP
jgi:ribosomal protein S18 acetylase RimI-like enzyme